MTVDENAALRGVEKTRDQAHQGRFAAAGLADEGDGFALLDHQVDVSQNRLAVIGKIQIAKFDLAFYRRLLVCASLVL